MASAFGGAHLRALASLRRPTSGQYLTELDRHAGELATNPPCWMPWNYRQTLDAPTTPLVSAR